MFNLSSFSHEIKIFFLSITVILLIFINSSSSEISGFVDSSNNLPQKVSIVGTISSTHVSDQDVGLEQMYYLFPISNLNNTYSGILTFTSSKPVQVQSINILTLNNTLKLPIQFGTLYTSPVNKTIVIPSNLLDEPSTSGSVQFSSNSIRFIATEPFLVTYSFSGEQYKSIIKNNIESGLEVYRQLIGTRS